MESVQCFGRLRVTKKKYYRGIDKPFIFKRFITRFNELLSTTTNVCTFNVFVFVDFV